MNLYDLKLIVDCYWAESDQEETLIPYGFKAAKERLKRAGLIQENPSHTDFVRITLEGIAFVDQLCVTELPKR